MICSLCMYLPPTEDEKDEDDYESVTVIDGQAVCVAHAAYVSSPHQRSLAWLVKTKGFATLSKAQEARR